MVLVIIIVVAWIVILGPSLIKRRARSVGGQSITSFHYQLRVLEHSAPEPLVAPAYRLRAVDGASSPSAITYPDSANPPVLTVVGAKELPRPALAFLGEPEPSMSATAASTSSPAIGYGEESDFGVPRVGVSRRQAEAVHWEAPALQPDRAVLSKAADGFARAQVRRRRRDTLAVLAGVLAVCVVTGVVTGSTAVWVLSALNAIALGAYMAVLVHLRRLAEESDRKLHYIDRFDARTHDVFDEHDEHDERQATRAGGPPSYVSGRYAHPSNWQAAAR